MTTKNPIDTIEVWEPIPDTIGYFASSQGRIKGPRTIYKGHVDPKGYNHVSIIQGGKRVYRKVSRLVASAFHGEDNRMVLHINGVPSDDRPENLKYGDAKENYNDAINHGTNCQGARHGNSLLTQNQVIEIRNKYIRNVYGYKQLAKEYGVTNYTIRAVILRKNWRHV